MVESRAETNLNDNLLFFCLYGDLWIESLENLLFPVTIVVEGAAFSLGGDETWNSNRGWCGWAVIVFLLSMCRLLACNLRFLVNNIRSYFIKFLFAKYYAC